MTPLIPNVQPRSARQEAVSSSLDRLETRGARRLRFVIGDRDCPLFGEKDRGEQRVHVVAAPDFEVTQPYTIDTLAGRYLYDSDTHGSDTRAPCSIHARVVPRNAVG